MTSKVEPPKDDLRGKLAAIEHERWSDWQQWVHAVYASKTQPFEKAIENWKRQIATPYSELTEREKASDMEQVDRYWPLIEEYIKLQQEALLDRLEKEVIGDDEPLVKADPMQKRSLEIRRNDLRAEQRQAIDKLRLEL